ncbi:NAD-dependent succinate-semialdehyde dehydrogenase [Rhodococcus sp. W8901]|uniref:NAD-dependent succinate-semialdehyde dehydrogenase n=1 Tax=Rhodococcus sp. W8901 TaxID=2742603 RepID=UPI001582DCDC|nr:NAD-dependent succinate-semialdehyde dehydrogenase [Rhodococcus sp. W8901]QKT11820.1 NAD-dependent succinate-semialdehyde dehydrogenase [Rhodococcus sp. W8901]
MTSTSTQHTGTSGPGAGPFHTVDPYTGRTIAEYPYLAGEQVDAVVDRAADAFDGWRALPVERRAQVLTRAAELMRERKDELAGLVTREMGKLIEESRAEVDIAADIVGYYAQRGPGFLRSRSIDVADGTAEVVNEPIGVLLGIEPWNFPLYQVARFAAPNLLLGNVVLLKHASSCAQTAHELERLFSDAGAPEGVYTNLYLNVSDVERVIAHPAVQGASLTGSEAAGASLGEIAGRHLKKCVLELGGSDPFVVLDADDLGGTLDAAAAARILNAGQSCVSAKRFIVPDAICDDFVAGLARRFDDLVVGDPSDPGTTLAPLSSEDAAQTLLEQIDDALDKGATVAAGGGRPENRGPDGQGAFVEATVLTDVTRGMRAFEEELFGPVAVVYRVADEDEAVELANSTRYGLGGAVFGSDPDRARAVADRIGSGMVWINRPTSTEPELPFGGVKSSGFGRELGDLGLFEFANRKLIRTAPAENGPRG